MNVGSVYQSRTRSQAAKKVFHTAIDSEDIDEQLFFLISGMSAIHTLRHLP